MSDESFDLVVVGGGISGACLAFDAALRGLKVALVEKGDFGGATSSASSKLLHGGIRYLQSLRVDKVRESALERVYFQNMAPHLCRYVPFLLPAFSGLAKGKAALTAAMLAYSLVSTGQNRKALRDDSHVPSPWSVSNDDLLEQIPWLDGREDMRGGIVLPECHMLNSERMTLSIIGGALANGGAAANYTEAVSLRIDNGRVQGLTVRDVPGDNTFDIETRVVANSAGPWIGAFNGKALGQERGPATAMSRGAHAVLRGLELPCAIGLPTKFAIEGVAGRGGRHMFMIPWRGHTLLGTSYSSHDNSIDKVEPTADDLGQLLEGVNGAAGREVISPENVAYAYAGLYPLTTDTVRAGVYQGSGDYAIIDHAKSDNVAGYFSVAGAKFTTARLLAEKACDQIVASSGQRFQPCSTRSSSVPAGAIESVSSLVEELATEFGSVVERDRLETLARLYGADSKAVLALTKDRPELAQPLSPDRETIQAEAVYCARNEMVSKLEDFVFRRTGLGTLGDPGKEAIHKAATLVSGELGWPAEKTEAEIQAVSSRFAYLNEVRNAL